MIFRLPLINALADKRFRVLATLKLVFRLPYPVARDAQGSLKRANQKKRILT